MEQWSIQYSTRYLPWASKAKRHQSWYTPTTSASPPNDARYQPWTAQNVQGLRYIASAITTASLFKSTAHIRQSGKSRESEWANVDYQQLRRTRQRRVSSTWQDGFEVLAIRFWLKCFRADLATNAHCSLAAVLLFIMEGVGPPYG